MKPDRNGPCPCGSGGKAKRCCLPVVEGASAAADPVALLRARYCAYGWGAVDCLIATSAGDAARDDRAAWRAELVAYCAELGLAGLDVLSSAIEGDRGAVHYRAGLVLRGRPVTLEERARYARMGGRWLYTGGEIVR